MVGMETVLDKGKGREEDRQLQSREAEERKMDSVDPKLLDRSPISPVKEETLSMEEIIVARLDKGTGRAISEEYHVGSSPSFRPYSSLTRSIGDPIEISRNRSTFSRFYPQPLDADLLSRHSTSFSHSSRTSAKGDRLPGSRRIPRASDQTEAGRRFAYRRTRRDVQESTISSMGIARAIHQAFFPNPRRTHPKGRDERISRENDERSFIECCSRNQRRA